MFLYTIITLSLLNSCSCEDLVNKLLEVDSFLGFQLDVNKTSNSSSNNKTKESLSDVLQVDLLHEEEGRSKKYNEILFPAVMGFKLAGLLSMVLFGMTVYVANSFAVSKLALALGIGMILAKFLYKSIDHGKYDIEIYPSQIHNQYPSAYSTYYSNAGYSHYPYSAYDTSGLDQDAFGSESRQRYNYAWPMPSNATSVSSFYSDANRVSAQQRLDFHKRKKLQASANQFGHITAKKYTINTK